MNKKNFIKLFAVIISFLLTNTLTVFAETNSAGKTALPEYQQTNYPVNINNNVSAEEKEKLLEKYFNNNNEQTTSDFDNAKEQLKKDGYAIVQDTKNPDAWIVSKDINGKKTCLTVYPFDENGETTINVENIKNIFNTYTDLTRAGYTVNCSEKTKLDYYSSLGQEGQDYIQLTTNDWTISKGQAEVTLSYSDDNGETISLNKINETFKFEEAKEQLKKDGYTIVQDTKNPDAWIVSKDINGKTICLTIYPFDENKTTTINVKNIKNIFNTYKDLTKAGYTVNCSGKTKLAYYSSLDKKGENYIQITANNWTISKGQTKVTISYFDDNGEKNISLSKVNETFKFEKAKAQLKKDGYTIVQDSKNDKAWIVSKKINGQKTCLTVYPFDKNGKATINVDNIKNIFNTYKDLTKAGYTVNCSGKTKLAYYSSLDKKGENYIQITANNWTISKGQTKVTKAYNDDGKIISLDKVNETFKFENAKAQLKKDGYNIVQDSKNPDAWIVSKKINGKTTCLTVYPFDKNGKATINVDNIKNIFNTYKDLTKAGYTVNCSGKTKLAYYSSLDKKGENYIQITANNWTISKGQTKVTMAYFNDNGRKAISLSKVDEAFKFEKAKAQLKKDGYNIVPDSKNPDAWIVSKKINGKMRYLTVYPFDKDGKAVINVKDIKKIFNSY